MYLPKAQFQLQTDYATRSRDCGPTSTSVAIDRATRGVKVPKIPMIRGRGGMAGDWTNSSEWTQAIESFDTRRELGGRWDRINATELRAAPADRWSQIVDHVQSGEPVIFAMDYGVLRRLAPRKTGSESFNGYHALTIVGDKPGKPSRWRDYDPLNDGRYRGCPKGPVWIPRSVLKEAVLRVGKEVVGSPAIWAVLVDKAERLEDGVEPIEPEPVVEPDLISMGSVLADLYEFRDTLTDPAAVDEAQRIIDDYEIVLGIDGDEDIVPDEAVQLLKP